MTCEELNKTYLTIKKVISRVSGLYLYNEDLLNNGNLYNKYYYLDNSNVFYFKNKFKTDYDVIDLLELNLAILKGLGIKDYKLYVNDKYQTMLNSLNIKSDGSSINDYEIDLGSYQISLIDYSFTIDIKKIFETNKCKSLYHKTNIHVLFIADTKNEVSEAYKIMNICRIGGLICEMNLHDEDEFDLTSRFTCYLDNDMLARYVINVCDNITDNSEEISIYDVYPYILNKINKIGSCATCQSKE